MRICVLIKSLPAVTKGGMENHALLLAIGIAKKGHEVTIITTHHPQGLEYENIAGVKIYYLKNTLSGRYSKSWSRESVKKFEELQKNNSFDIIHSQSAGAYSLLRKGLNQRYKIPVVITFHGLSYSIIKTSIRSGLSLNHPLRTLKAIGYILQSLYYLVFVDIGFVRRANALIAINENEKKALENVIFGLKKPIFLIYNGIDTDYFSPVHTISVRDKYGIKNDDVLLLSVCRLVENKGVQYLIKALPPLLNNYNIKLVIVGWGNYGSTLMALVRKLNLNSNVFFAKSVKYENTSAFYNSCDIFVNPTLGEIMPLTTLEAMACQKPVIASCVGAMSRIINQGKDGILVPPGDVDALTRALDYAISNPVWMENLGHSARKKILREFSLELMCERTVKVYEYLMSKQDKNRKDLRCNQVVSDIQFSSLF